MLTGGASELRVRGELTDNGSRLWADNAPRAARCGTARLCCGLRGARGLVVQGDPWWVPRGSQGSQGPSVRSLSRRDSEGDSSQGGYSFTRADNPRYGTTLRGVVRIRNYRLQKVVYSYFGIYRPTRRLSAVSLVVVCWCDVHFRHLHSRRNGDVCRVSRYFVWCAISGSSDGCSG